MGSFDSGSKVGKGVVLGLEGSLGYCPGEGFARGIWTPRGVGDRHGIGSPRKTDGTCRYNLWTAGTQVHLRSPSTNSSTTHRGGVWLKSVDPPSHPIAMADKGIFTGGTTRATREKRQGMALEYLVFAGRLWLRAGRERCLGTAMCFST